MKNLSTPPRLDVRLTAKFETQANQWKLREEGDDSIERSRRRTMPGVE